MKNANLIHLKYVDDLSLAESINLPEKLVLAPGRQQPDTYHARTGHVLPVESSHVFQQLRKTEEYARVNEMKINKKKTKLMLFNPCTAIDFSGWPAVRGCRRNEAVRTHYPIRFILAF